MELMVIKGGLQHSAVFYDGMSENWQRIYVGMAICRMNDDCEV